MSHTTLSCIHTWGEGLSTTKLQLPLTKPTMPIFGERPFTSITVKINQLTTPDRNADLEDDSIELSMESLLDLIKIQPSGSVEAARAIRKRIKYGTPVSLQILALNLLELLVLNGGPKVGHVIASDDRLNDLLKLVISGHGRSGLGGSYEQEVVQRARELSIGWKSEFKDMDGYKGFANLWRSIPRKNSRLRTTSAAGHSLPADVEEDHTFHPSENHLPRFGDWVLPPPRPSTASPYGGDDNKSKKKKKKSRSGVQYADKAYQIPQINYKLEAPKIRTTIAECHTHTTALGNALLALPEGAVVLDNKKVAAEFEKCRKIRRKVLRYLQFVGAGDSSSKSKEVQELDDEFLGSLIVANDQLVEAFRTYDKKSGYSDENPAPHYEEEDESDESYYTSDESEDEVAQRIGELLVEGSSAALRSAPPVPRAALAQRQTQEPKLAPSRTIESADSADPFGDSHAVNKSLSVYY